MGESRNPVSRRIRAARQWLVRAEESFEGDRAIRGELDLLLAEAELQRVREEHRGRHWLWRIPLFSHGMAVAVAVMIAVFSAGGLFWLAQTQSPVPPPALRGAGTPPSAVRLQPALPEPAVAPAKAAEPVRPAETRTEVRPAPAVVPGPAADDIRARTEKEVVLPPDERDKLVRAAGKALRGQ